MKSTYYILKNRNKKLFKRKLLQSEKLKRRNIRKQFHNQKNKESYFRIAKELNNDFSMANVIEKWLPTNLKLIITERSSQFSIENLSIACDNCKGKFLVPQHFSIVEKPKESYELITSIFGALLFQRYEYVSIDYSICEEIDLGAQVLLDVIQKEILIFYERCKRHPMTIPRIKSIVGKNVNNENVKKMLFSVGSPAIHSKKTINYPDIIKYPLCIFDASIPISQEKKERQKDIDCTNLIDYVLECLGRFNKVLSPEKREDLAIVISEILINAEEHSSTNIRYSIGYLQEHNENGHHYGIFKLAIFNFGDTIYQKFKSPDCPNKHIVSEMIKLSNSYNSKKLFLNEEFEEETLWTLYALQEGVTTVPATEYLKRGNGSIQFIEKFFSIKESNEMDSVSKLSILSGKTSIIFDGKYELTEGFNSIGEKCTYMTFNKSGNIYDKPDKEYVKFAKYNFPGTIISARILFNEDDFIKNEIK